MLTLLLWQTTPVGVPAVSVQLGAMLYERAIHLDGSDPQGGAVLACAVLDAQIFPHAAPSLSDLRIFAAPASRTGDALRPGKAQEVAYAITLSESATDETQTAHVLNLGSAGGSLHFDLEMPPRAYTDVTLTLDSALPDFVGTATVSGSNSLPGSRTKLGSFTLFDLTSRHLSRNTTLPLSESEFAYLHVILTLHPVAGAMPETAAAATLAVPRIVQGAEVPPSREAQILYTTVAQSLSIATVGRESRATFQVPARVPVERVSFQLAPGFKDNFSRNVRITALAVSGSDARSPLLETVSGTIRRVHASQAGREIRTEQLAIPAVLGANLQRAANVQVAIENGDDTPLPIAAVHLEMRQRKICFQAPTDRASGEDSTLALFYGDPELAAPVYDYARRLAASRATLIAEIGPERLNADYRAPAAQLRPFASRHHEVLWMALIAVLCALCVAALRSAKNVRRPT